MTERLTIPSPVGPLTLVAEAGALVAIRFEGGPCATLHTVGGDSDRTDTLCCAAADPSDHGSDTPTDSPLYDGAPPLLQEAARQLAAYFAGERRSFDLPLRPAGTAFQQRVWAALREIPYGEVCSYGRIAARIGRPTASRAVGMANHRNPLPIVIPCHRVVGASGALTGYAGGLPIKERLLRLEGYEPYLLR